MRSFILCENARSGAATLTCANIAELEEKSNSLRKDQHNGQERLGRQPTASIVAASTTTWWHLRTRSCSAFKTTPAIASQMGWSVKARWPICVPWRLCVTRAAPWNIWGGQRLDLGRAGAEHMRGDICITVRGGLTTAPFAGRRQRVWRQSNRGNANELHSYTVPRVHHLDGRRDRQYC